MMWLLPSCLSALGTEDSSLPCEPSGQPVEWSVTASGKATQRPSSWRGWKTRPWSRLLFGAVTSPSFQPPHFSEWTSLPPASHASPGAALDKVEAPRTSDGYGTTSHHFFAEWDREQSSWRTSRPSLFAEDWSSSSLTWPRSGSMRSGRCYARVMSEHPTSESASLFWPTMLAADSHGHAQPGTILEAARALWPTPVAHDDQKSPEAHLKMKADMPGGPRSAVTSLTVLAKMWPTANAADGDRKSEKMKRGNPTLLGAARSMWPTATAQDSRASGGNPSTTGSHGTTLTDAAARNWSTPASRDGKGGELKHTKGGRDLSTDALSLRTVATWTTPKASSYKRAASPSEMRRTTPDLRAQASLQGQTTEPPGPSSRPVLNPRFVEALMGLPTGWVLPMPLSMINLERSATESSPPKPQQPSASFQSALVCEVTP